MPILQTNWASEWPERPTVGSLHSVLGYEWFSTIILLTWLKHSYNSLAFSREQFVFLRTFTHPTHASCIFTPPTNLITLLCCHSFSQPRKICVGVPFGESDQFVSNWKRKGGKATELLCSCSVQCVGCPHTHLPPLSCRGRAWGW